MCSKEGTQYYEAVLQVRSSKLKVLEESVELLKKRVENLRHKGIFINKVKRQNEGYDLYMTNKKIAQALARELYEAYGGVFKASPHLHSKNRQTSKNMYRVNVFIRLPGFEKGEILVTPDDKVLKVAKLGKKIKLVNLDDNSAVNVEYSKLSYHILKKHSTYISRIHPNTEVINPYDFQSSMVKNNPNTKFEIGQEVHVVVHKGIYIVD
jgi:NMD protein affecting ribosome stability and mRNA decay